MVEFGNNLDVDEDFDVLHSILDFPMECLEEDEDAEGWDISNPECLGPIPSNVLMEPPISDEKFNFRHPDVLPLPVAPIAGVGVSELKQLPKRVDDSNIHILPLRKISEVQESPSFRTQSPVSVLESSGSASKEKSLPITSDNFIPVRSRSKRARYAGVNPWLLAAHGLPTSKPAPPNATDIFKSSRSLDVADPAHVQNTCKKCSHCQSTKTPQWRWGPLGKNTLCNACGVRYRSGRLFPEYRPASSPTFARSQHSNSHRKVIEMRTAKTKLAPLSPKTEAKIEELPIPLQMEARFLEPPSAQLEVQIGAPEGKQLTDASSSHVNRKQLVDTSGSLISQQIAPMRKKLAEYDDTCSSQNKDASVQESSRGPGLRERWLSFLSIRSNHIQPAGENLSLPASHPPSTCRNTSYARKGKESGRNYENTLMNASVGRASIENAWKHEHARMKKCAHCESTETPQWRQGPLGPRTLCNACGVRYRSGRLVPEYRPAASPTFVPSKHSNLHSEVLQMIKAEHASLRRGGTTNIPSPQPS